MVKLNRPSHDHWDLIDVCGEEYCFVCERPLIKKKGEVKYIGRHKYTGDPMWRHESCCPGSMQWMNKFEGYLDANIKKIEQGGVFNEQSK